MGLQQTIFGYFGGYEKIIDTHKDVDDKGILERFNEALGQEYDENLEPFVSLLFQNVQDPVLCIPKYVQRLEVTDGNDSLYLSPDVDVRRSIQHFITRYWAIKGTKRFLKDLLGLIFLVPTVTEYFSSYSFDSPVTFDDVERRWDMKCQTCSKYRIDLVRSDSTTTALSSTEIAAVLSVVTTNQPLDAILVGVWFNGLQVI
jgi:hypothetical protein